MDFPEPEKILVAGDWHGNSTWAAQIIRHAGMRSVDTIIHVGDFGWWTPSLPTHHFLETCQEAAAECGIRIYWARGNHEFHPGIDEWDDATEGEPWFDKRYPNIIHLPNGFRWEWWGRTWLALGGAHSVDRLMRKEGFSWWPEEHFTDAHMVRAMTGGPVDVMITHDCPSGVNIPGIPSDPSTDKRGDWPMSELITSREQRDRLAEVVDVVQPKLLIHGHYHLRYTAKRTMPDGWVTAIHGLDCDGSSLSDHTLFLNRD